MTLNGYAFVACTTATILSAIARRGDTFTVLMAIAWIAVTAFLVALAALSGRPGVNTDKTRSNRDRPPWI